MKSLVEVKAGNILIESWKDYNEAVIYNMKHNNNDQYQTAVGKMFATYDIAAAMFGPEWAKENLV